jgi:hypothetical protein
LFNYDHDPNNTMDVMIADGNHTGSFFIQANRVATSFVACGDAASGTINLGSLASSEMVVTAARIHPTYTLNGGSIRFYLSNETPENWVLATACPDASGDLCASFPHPVGRTVKWKVEMCSNASHTQTPVLSNVSATFDYTRAREHFRAGVVVNDGVAYLGGFRQPGDRGHLFAVNAGLSTTYWDASTWINNANDSARNIYTSNPSRHRADRLPHRQRRRDAGHARRCQHQPGQDGDRLGAQQAVRRRQRRHREEPARRDPELDAGDPHQAGLPDLVRLRRRRRQARVTRPTRPRSAIAAAWCCSARRTA